MRLGTDFILDALALEEIDHLFMVPGGLVDPFLPALGRQKALRPIVAAQEGGAAYMADGYARASGKLGAALCIGGPGHATADSHGKSRLAVGHSFKSPLARYRKLRQRCRSHPSSAGHQRTEKSFPP